MNTPHTPKIDDPGQLYRETIVQHARNPVGFNKQIAVTHSHEQFNPLCGDRIKLMLEMSGDEVLEAAFEGEACAICMASASLLCELAPNQSRSSLAQQRQWLEAALAGSQDPAEHLPLSALLGVRAYPSRVRCALLPWEALSAAMFL